MVKLRLWMMFEVISTSRELTENSLKSLIDNLKKEGGIEVLKESYEDISEVERPHPKVEVGYSQVCEVELWADSFPKIFLIVMNYGPSAIEILEPDKIHLTLSEAQESLNYVAGMMHKFLEAGAGGVVLFGQEK